MSNPNDPNPQSPTPGDGPQNPYGSSDAAGQGSAPQYGAAPQYGSAQPYGGSPQYPAAGSSSGTNPLAIVSLVLGILGILTACFYGVPGILFGGIAIVLAVLGGKKAKRGEAGQGGLAKAGLVTGIISTVLGVIILVAFIVFGAAILNSAEECDPNEMSDEEYSQCLIDNL